MSSQIQPTPVIPVDGSGGEVLGYASARVFERGVFRLIGWISVTVASMLLLSLLMDMLLLPQGRLPSWWMTVSYPPDFQQDYVFRMVRWYSHGLEPVAQKLVALPMLAGGIGCLRRYARTRLWMMTYAVTQLLLHLASALIALYAVLVSNAPPVFSKSIMLVGSDGLYGVATFVITTAWPALILYLMTRPYVAMLFAK